MNNLKPFILPEALAGKAVMLRDGQKAYVRHRETELPVGEDARLFGFIADGSGRTWCENGNYFESGMTDSYDIIGMYPETRIINGFEMPAPETKELEHGTEFYLASPVTGQLYVTDIWSGHRIDKIRLERGLVFLNKEDAIATAKAMLGIDPYEGDES